MCWNLLQLSLLSQGTLNISYGFKKISTVPCTIAKVQIFGNLINVQGDFKIAQNGIAPELNI